MSSKLVETIRKNMVLFVAEVFIFLVAVCIILTRPIGPKIPVLENTYALFGLSSLAMISLFFIGLHFLVQWFSYSRENSSYLLWGVGFIVYSILFFGMCPSALGIEWANMDVPAIFFAFRQVMIIFLALVYLGVAAKIFPKNKIFVCITTTLILIGGYIAFIYGLLIAGDVDMTMYLFTYLYIIPVAIFMAYVFYLFARYNSLISGKIISAAWIYYGFTYAFWAPFHVEEIMYLWYVMYAQFILSILLMLLGHILLPYELKIKKLEEEIEMLHT